ncbi:MAG: YlzJ-like family protein [bacterium]|jgi:hypothetical protein
MLYTIVPMETVMQGIETFSPTYSEIEQEGRRLLVEPLGLTEARVIRLLSPDAQDYLLPQWQPGSIVKFSPQK